MFSSSSSVLKSDRGGNVVNLAKSKIRRATTMGGGNNGIYGGGNATQKSRRRASREDLRQQFKSNFGNSSISDGARSTTARSLPNPKGGSEASGFLPSDLFKVASAGDGSGGGKGSPSSPSPGHWAAKSAMTTVTTNNYYSSDDMSLPLRFRKDNGYDSVETGSSDGWSSESYTVDTTDVDDGLSSDGYSSAYDSFLGGKNERDGGVDGKWWDRCLGVRGRRGGREGRGKRRRRCARAAAGAFVLATLTTSVIYKLVVEGSYGSVADILPDYGNATAAAGLFGGLLGRIDGEAEGPAEEEDTGWATELRYRTLPQGGSVVEMVPTARLSQDDVGSNNKETVPHPAVANPNPSAYHHKEKVDALREKSRMEHLDNWKESEQR